MLIQTLNFEILLKSMQRYEDFLKPPHILCLFNINPDAFYT